MYQYELHLKKDGQTIARETQPTEESLRNSIHKLEDLKEKNKIVTETVKKQTLDK